MKNNAKKLSIFIQNEKILKCQLRKNKLKRKQNSFKKSHHSKNAFEWSNLTSLTDAYKQDDVFVKPNGKPYIDGIR
jgi:hypothetical protein